MENDNLTGPQQSLIHTDEDRIYEVFDVELRDINGRAADALEYACELVKVHFQVHPTLPCRVSMFDKISVRKAFIRIGRLLGDVKSKLLNTVDFNGLVSMQLSEPLTCDKVKRQKYDLKSLARRGGDEGDVAKIYGYYNQNELFLSEIVAARAPHFLEIMDSVRICQQGLVSIGEGENERVCADLNRAISDNDIACICPLLVRPEMAGYELAVSNCSLDQMEHISKELRKWKPKRVVERKLDPNWQELRNIFFKVGNSKSRFPSSNRTGEASDEDQSVKKLPELKRWAMEAWQAKQCGMPVIKIATTLSEKYKDPKITQPRVSEQIKKACMHAGLSGLAAIAAKVIPKINNRAPARTLDPSIADLGNRTDGRSHLVRDKEKQKAKDGDDD